MKKTHTLIILCCLLLIACERDDICAENTAITPLLVIDFFDADNPSEQKAPTNLFIVEENATVGLAFNTASIAIPLRTDLDQTRFNFILNNGSENSSESENIDSVVFNYLPQEEFVSKACGFKVTYQALQDQVTPLEDGSWIDNITILNATIEDDSETHIHIFH